MADTGPSTHRPLIVLLLGLALLGAAGCKESRAPEPSEANAKKLPPDAILSRQGMSKEYLLNLRQSTWGVAVVRINRVKVHTSDTSGQRVAQYDYAPIDVYRPGDNGGGQTIWSYQSIILYLDEASQGEDKLLKEGHTYLIVCAFGRWPTLQRSIEVSGADDPVALQAKAWLAAP